MPAVWLHSGLRRRALAVNGLGHSLSPQKCLSFVTPQKQGRSHNLSRKQASLGCGAYWGQRIRTRAQDPPAKSAEAWLPPGSPVLERGRGKSTWRICVFLNWDFTRSTETMWGLFLGLTGKMCLLFWFCFGFTSERTGNFGFAFS